MKPSIFTKIINGDLPCYKVYEDEYCLAFLDIFPIQKAHTLLVPKRQEDVFWDLNSKEKGHLMDIATKLSKAIQTYTNCKRIGMSVLGFDVPHAHIHLVPMNETLDMNFQVEKQQFTPKQMKEIAKEIGDLVRFSH